MADERDQQAEVDRVGELIRRCEVSRSQRRSIGMGLRDAYERGNSNGPRSVYSILRPHLNRVRSYLFSPGTARFGVHFPPAVRATWLPTADVIRDEFRARWTDSGADLVALMLLEQALVCGATVGKVQHDPGTGFRIGYIEPWDFGLSREDVPQLDEQDVFAHWYTLSLPQAERWADGQRNKDTLLAIAREHARTPGGQRTGMGLIVTAVTSTFPNATTKGGFMGDPGDAGSADVVGPLVDEPVVTFVDLWEYRQFRRRKVGSRRHEEFWDWLVTTCVADVNVLVAQRRNPDLPWVRTGTDVVLTAEHPFGLMVPRPRTDYAWGTSELVALLPLQEWIDTQLDGMKKVVARQLDPSNFFSGISDAEEAGRALGSPGGSYGAPDSTARMETLRVVMGNEPFEFFKLLQALVADTSNMPETLQGQPPSGVRATGQLTTLAGIGGGPVRSMALVVEDGLGTLATKGFHTMQRHDPTAYPRPDGGEFLLAQVPPGVTMRIDAHSAAPIFQEQTQAKAALLQQAGAVEPDDYVELIDPPGRDELKLKAKEIAKRKAQLAQEMLRIREEQALRGRAPGRPPK